MLKTLDTTSTACGLEFQSGAVSSTATAFPPPPPNLFLRVTQAGSGFLLLLFVFSTETKATSSMKHACALPKENAVVHR